MNRWFLLGGLILLAVLALGFAEPTYAAGGDQSRPGFSGRDRSSNHHFQGTGGGDHRRPGFSGRDWSSHPRSQGPGRGDYSRHRFSGHGWNRDYGFHGGVGLFLPPIPIPVPVPVPPLGFYSSYGPNYSAYAYDDCEPDASRVWIRGHWARRWNEEYQGWERVWVPGYWDYR